MEPHPHEIPPRLLVVLSLVLSMCMTVYGQDNGPIVKKVLVKSLREDKLAATVYLEQINQSGVNFRLTVDNEKEIRKAGAYLGTKGLDDLIAAIRSSPYRIVVLLTDINPVRAEVASVQGRNYGLTETILEKLLATFLNSSDVVVKHVPKAFDDDQAAIEEGLLNKANHVLWGYFVTKKSVRVSLFFSFVQGTQELSSVRGLGTIEYPVSEVDEQFGPNDEIANDVTYAMLVASGVARLEAGELDLAIERLERATKLPVQTHIVNTTVASESLFRGYFRRSQGSGSQHKWDLAISDLTRAIEIKSNSGEAYWQRGIFHYAKATAPNYNIVEDKNAVADLERAADLLPDHAGVYLGLGQAHLRMSDHEKEDPSKFRDERNEAKLAFQKAMLLAKTNNPSLVVQLEIKLREAEKEK